MKRHTLGTVVLLLFLVASCSSLACPEPFGQQHVLLFVTPLHKLTDAGQMDITIPRHWGGSDSVHSCKVWDFDFDNTQIQATGRGSLTVVSANQVPTTDPSWKAGGYALVVKCQLPAGADSASDTISVSIVRNGQTLYADQWAQACQRS